jgi:hypothetical protein
VWGQHGGSGKVRGGKLASWRGTRYCSVLRSTQEVWDVVHFPGYFRMQIRGFHDLLSYKIHLLHRNYYKLEGLPPAISHPVNSSSLTPFFCSGGKNRLCGFQLHTLNISISINININININLNIWLFPYLGTTITN